MVRMTKVWRIGRFEIRYELEDGSVSGFRCAEEVTMFIINAWCEKHGFQDALSPFIILNKPCTVYDPITKPTKIEQMLEQESSDLGRCKNCGAFAQAHLPLELRVG